MALFPQRRPLTLNLRLGEEIFPVKKTDLLEKLALFQKDPALLSSDDYEVKTNVPSADFEDFLRIVEGGPLSVSEATCDSFWRLSEEFGFEFLSAACTAFLASKEYFIETAPVLRPRVTITVRTRSRTYESFKSFDEIVSFGLDLIYADNDSIVVEGMKGKDRLMEKAIESVYCNTVSDIGLSEATKPFLSLVLWEIQDQLQWDNIDAMIYCMNRLNEIAPTAFDKARLLLLSQSDLICRDDFVLTATKTSKFIVRAIDMLEAENNGRWKEAKDLLGKLRNTGRFAPIGPLGPPLWTNPGTPEQIDSDAGLDLSLENTVTNTRSRAVPIPANKPSWFRRLFASWFGSQSAGVNSPDSAGVGESTPVPRDWPDRLSWLYGRRVIELPVVDINWFKSLS
jgi:hypothetical protein